MTHRQVKATIFIPTYNGEAYIRDILNAIFVQRVEFEYEVLIIDSGSTDRTLSIIKCFLDDHDNLRLHNIPNSEFGHGKTRNLAAKMANGQFVVYLTHDAIPAHQDWLYEILRPFDISPKVVGVLGKQVPRSHCFPLLKYEILHVFKQLGPDHGTTLYYEDNFIQDDVVRDAVGFYSDVNSAARRSILMGEIPYQDVRYAEDQLFGREIIEKGYIKAYAPRASVVHSNDMKIKEYKQRMFDETLALRKTGIIKNTISKPVVIRAIVRGVFGDTVRIFRDDYTWRRKIYWLAVNPLVHIEKWIGVYAATHVNLDDSQRIKALSLEENRKT